MKLFNKIRSLSRKGKLAVTAVVLASAVAIPLVVNAEFYPVRPVYDYNKFDPSNNDCNDPSNIATQNGRCGSMDGPVLNSFINTPSYGDERAFFDGRRSDMATNTNADAINNVNQGSKEVVLRTYVHNNANNATNASGKGIAKNTKVRVALPTATEQVLRARSYISASNAAQVEDTADLLGTEKFNVSYVPGSAKLLRGTSTYTLSDSIVTTGALIGDKVMDGNLPGCFEYAALVEIRVKINVVPAPDLQLVKETKVKGTTGWFKEISTKPGDRVQFRLTTKNIGNATLNSVSVRDALPAHLAVVPGSVRLIDSTQDTVQSDAPLFGGGLGLGTYPSAGIRYVIFDATTKDDFTGCEVRLRNFAYAKSQQTPVEDQDSAVVNVKKENCNPVVPVTTCDSLTAVKTTGFGVKFTAKATATNATISKYNFNFGDGQTQSVTGTTVDHTYATYGTYTATVTVDFLVNGQTVSKTSEACKVTVKFDKPVVPVYTCDSLKAEKIGDRKVKFTGAATAAGGATIQNYIYNFGDGNKTTTNSTMVEHTYANFGTYETVLTVEFLVNNQKVTASGPQCKVTVKFDKPDEPKPVYTCDSLKAEKLGARKVKFTANATAKNGATIKQYVYSFGDSTTQTSTENMINYTYDKDGTYTASVKVEFLVNGQTVSAEGPQCKVTVKFDTPEEPEKPIYTCDSLSVQKTGGRTVKLTASATAKNGAEIKRYIYSFGDGGEQTTDKNMVEHTYAKDGQYVARVKVQFAVKNQTVTAESDKCAVVITFTSEKCKVPGKEHLPADSPECKTVVTTTGKTPTVLPDTGAGSFAAAFAAATGLGSLGFNLITRRSRNS